MIEELTSYFSEGFYKEKDERIVKALEDYEAGREISGEEGTKLRESARAELEEQLIASGQAEADTVFINPEEFFPEGKRDEERIDNFRKDMTKKLANQQMLWSFAGTTGSMTVITEKHLESLGRDLDRLKPAALRRETAKKTPKTVPGAVPLYLYGDGSAGQVYDKGKAKLSFDKCRDKSGFDWKQIKYDPNYSVEKSGWFGGLNKEDIWEAIDTSASPSAGIAGQTAPKREIELVNTLNGALIFDAALLLCGPEEEEYYYSLDGELYGAVKTDRAGTVERLKEALCGQAPAGVVLPTGIDEETRGAYGELLAELDSINYTNGMSDDGGPINFAKGGVGPRVFLESDDDWQELLVEDRVQREELAQATFSLGAATRLRQSGLDEIAIENFMTGDASEIEVPLNPFVDKDRKVLLSESLSSVELEVAASVRGDVDSWFNAKKGMISTDNMVHVLPAVTAALPLLAAAMGNGVGAEAVLDEAYSAGLGKGTSAGQVKLNGRISLEELSRGVTPFGSGAAGAEATTATDFLNEAARTAAARTAGLKEGELASLAESIDKLNMPPMNRKEFNKRLASSLASYRAVQMSTGMTVSDLVSTVASITMKRPEAKRLGGKDVYFEESLEALLAAGVVQEMPTKAITRDELFKPLLTEEALSVVAASSATSVQGVAEATKTKAAPALDNKTALTVTGSLLAALASSPSPDATILSSRQLGGLESLYIGAGASANTAQEAVKKWEAVKFTPEEYKAVRTALKKKLEGTGASRVNSPVSPVIADAGSRGAVMAVSQFTSEEQKALQAVMEAYRAEERATGSGMEHPMTNEMLMPFVHQALAGQWSGVPSSVRPMMNRAVGRTSGVRIPTFKSPSSKILEDTRKQMASAVTYKGTPIRPVTRQIPQTITPAISGKSGYSRIGYRVNPSRGQSFPIHKQAVGTSLEGLGPDYISYTPPKLDIVSGIAQNVPKLPTFEQEKLTIQAIASDNHTTKSYTQDFSHPFMNGGGALPGFDIFRGAAGFPGGMNMPSKEQNPQISPGLTQGQNSKPLSRLDRINANYEQDKASLWQGEQRMLARSESRSVGHAGGSGKQRKKYTPIDVDDLVEDIKGV